MTAEITQTSKKSIAFKLVRGPRNSEEEKTPNPPHKPNLFTLILTVLKYFTDRWDRRERMEVLEFVENRPFVFVGRFVLPFEILRSKVNT